MSSKNNISVKIIKEFMGSTAGRQANRVSNLPDFADPTTGAAFRELEKMLLDAKNKQFLRFQASKAMDVVSDEIIKKLWKKEYKESGDAGKTRMSAHFPLGDALSAAETYKKQLLPNEEETGKLLDFIIINKTIPLIDRTLRTRNISASSPKDILSNNEILNTIENSYDKNFIKWSENVCEKLDDEFDDLDYFDGFTWSGGEFPNLFVTVVKGNLKDAFIDWVKDPTKDPVPPEDASLQSIGPEEPLQSNPDDRPAASMPGDEVETAPEAPAAAPVAAPAAQKGDLEDDLLTKITNMQDTTFYKVYILLYKAIRKNAQEIAANERISNSLLVGQRFASAALPIAGIRNSANLARFKEKMMVFLQKGSDQTVTSPSEDEIQISQPKDIVQGELVAILKNEGIMEHKNYKGVNFNRFSNLWK